ncbi:hypothetical protein ACP4OV_018300 [Aristida adscensionis]
MEDSTSGIRAVFRRVVQPESASSPDSLPSEPEVIHLTPWDLSLLTVDQIQKGILLSKSQTGGEHFVDDLASSFAHALGIFYPLASRLTALEITNSVSSPGLIIALCCNGKGAEFIHATAPGVTVSDIITPLYILPVVWSFFTLNGLLRVDAVVDSPVLAAQLTELEDSVFVAMPLNHGIDDGACSGASSTPGWRSTAAAVAVMAASSPRRRQCSTGGSWTPARCRSLCPSASWRTKNAGGERERHDGRNHLVIAVPVRAPAGDILEKGLGWDAAVAVGTARRGSGSPC